MDNLESIACPYLGSIAGPDSYWPHPSPQNRCYALGAATSVDELEQRSLCLSEEHPHCPRFAVAKEIRASAAAQAEQTPAQANTWAPLKVVIGGVIVIAILFVCAVALIMYQADRLSRQPAGSTLLPPATSTIMPATATFTHTPLPAATATFTPLPTATFSPVPLPTATFTPVPTPVPDTEPPVIAEIQKSADPINQQDCPEPVKVIIQAQVTDASGLAWVHLYYQAPGMGDTWRYTTMRQESPQGPYKASLGPSWKAGTLRYYIHAQDKTGQEAQSDIGTVTVIDCRPPTPTPLPAQRPASPTPRLPTPTPRATPTRAPTSTPRPTSTASPTRTITPTRTPTVIVYGVTLTAGQTSAQVRAGETASFDVLVGNTATLTHNVNLTLYPAVPAGWAARLYVDGADRGTGPVTVSLSPSGTKTVTVRITAASDAQPSDVGEAYLSAVSAVVPSVSASASFTVTVRE